MDLSRRGFVAASLALPALPAPSDRVTVGIIGSGARAVFETRQYPFFPQAEIVAVCDAQQTRRESAKAVLEKAGVKPGIRLYSDFRELLAARDIDAVYIATPDHWHAPITVAAMKAGKHVHSEKPLGVHIAADLAARDAVHKYKKVFQYGAERRATADARKAVEVILNGRIGQIRKIYVVSPPSEVGGSATPVLEPPPGFDYDMWLGPAPMKPFCKDRVDVDAKNRQGIFFIYDYCTGFMSNWGAHPLDQVQWWADHAGRKSPPVKYEGTGKFPTEGLYDTCYEWDVRCTYDDGLVLHFVDSVSYRKYDDAPHPEMPWGRRGVTNVHNGAVFIGTEGWVIIAYEKVVAHPASIMDSTITEQETHLPDAALARIPDGMSKGFQQVASAGLHMDWIQAIRTGSQPVSHIDGAVRSDLVSLLSELCVRTGAPLTWDPVKETIVGNDAARKMMKRPARPPWDKL